MESFFRYISYVDYYESGVRIRNAGFLRWKIRDGRHQAELQIKDGPAVTGEYFLVEERSRSILGSIYLRNGEGSFRGEYQGRYLGETGIDSTAMQALQVDLGQGRYLRVRAELPRAAEQEEKIEPYEAVRKEPEPICEVASEVSVEKQKEVYEAVLEASKEEAKPEESKKLKLKKESMDLQSTDNLSQKAVAEGSGSKSFTPEAEKPLSGNKWSQLCSMFPVVHPFPGGRPFVSITPTDFIILQEAYQKLVQNSFLLHGFYNYQHMILGQLEEKEETPYYLGVPGVYYERERQAAQMFGFVGFEGSEQPVQSGSFGYYMIPVEI